MTQSACPCGDTGFSLGRAAIWHLAPLPFSLCYALGVANPLFHYRRVVKLKDLSRQAKREINSSHSLLGRLDSDLFVLLRCEDGMSPAPTKRVTGKSIGWLAVLRLHRREIRVSTTVDRLRGAQAADILGHITTW